MSVHKSRSRIKEKFAGGPGHQSDNILDATGNEKMLAMSAHKTKVWIRKEEEGINQSLMIHLNTNIW